MMRGFAQVQAAIAATSVCMVCTKKLLIANTAGYRQPVRGEVVSAETHCACAPRVDLPHGGPAYQLPTMADQLVALNDGRALHAAAEQYAAAFNAWRDATEHNYNSRKGELEDAARSLCTTVCNQQLGFGWLEADSTTTRTLQEA